MIFNRSINYVSVVDIHNKFLSYTHPAKARKLLKGGRAVIFKSDPFTIKLLDPKDRRGKMKRDRKEKSVISFTEYFKEPRDVYVQNLSNTNVQFQCYIANNVAKNIILQKNKRPINLTQIVSFGMLKDSLDFRELLNRDPQILRLMDEGEYREFYERLAKRNKSNLDAEISKTNKIQRNIMEKKVDAEDTPKTIDQTRLEDEYEPTLESIIHPRTAALCAQVSTDVPKDQRLNASDMMDELEGIEDELKPEDLEYIMSHGTYKSIKNWASKRLSEVSEELEDEE